MRDRKLKNRILCVLLASILIVSVLGMVGCGGGKFVAYERYDNPLAGIDVGGANELAVSEGDGTITVENEKVRIVFYKGNGSIKEYVNKETKQFLVKDVQPTEAFSVEFFDRTVGTGDFSYQISQDTADLKELSFFWKINDKTTVLAKVILKKGDDTVRFQVGIAGNDPEDSIVNVEYPIFKGIGALCEGRTDQFVSPVASGFLFENPAKNFNRENTKIRGLNKANGMYPQGWHYPMQFMSYITEGIGGFYLGTNDGGNTVKSFTFYADGNDTIRSSIHHFVDDTAEVDISFDYEVEIANLTKGYWQEAGDRYFAFAVNQAWMKKGRLEEREDINKTLFEDTALVNFGIYGNAVGNKASDVSEYIDEKRTELYSILKDTIEGKILNIFNTRWMPGQAFDDRESADWDTIFPANVSEEFIEKIESAGDQYILFEFNTLFNSSYRLFTDINNFWKKECIQSETGDLVTFKWENEVGVREYWKICPASKEWYEFRERVEREITGTYGSNGFYHDVGVAMCPVQCYDTTHVHGTKVNIVDEYLELEKRSKEIANEYGQFTAGQELVYEQLLPYTDLYQARANGGLMTWMEHGRFWEGLREGTVEKIPLFDYVYHAYGALRMDSFMVPVQSTGDGFYHATGFTVLNGGLPEFNFEFYNLSAIADNLHLPYVEFIDELGKARTTYGKEFLVYGDMRKAPKVSNKTVSYHYLNQNVSDGTGVLEGDATYDQVLTSAYEHDGKIGIFLLNIANKKTSTKFVLEAERFYGIKNGEVKLYDKTSGTYKTIAVIENGEANCSVQLPSREVVMLVIE